MPLQKLMIAAITPPILEKGLVWFEQHERRIEGASSPFWQRNTIALYENQKIMASELTRKLADFGYQKYQNVDLPGEFAQAGGIVTLFPVNRKNAVRLEFAGNTIESIEETEKKNPALRRFCDLRG